MNPCPCGYFGHPGRKCSCSAEQMRRYLSRVSGPLLDRIDIHAEVLPVDYTQLASREKAESSSCIRGRVALARERQLKRYAGTGIVNNAGITPAMLREACRMEPAAETMLKAAFERLGLSARGYDRVLKVARTIADLDGAEIIQTPHISQAVQFRSLDRKYWQPA
jgi:magnesium chelatase family protein